MKAMLMVLIAAGPAGLLACADPADRRKLERDLEQRLEQLDGRLTELRARAQEAGAESKERLRELLADLEVRRRIAADRLKDARSASRDSWERFKDDARSAVDNLGDAVDKAWRELKN